MTINFQRLLDVVKATEIVPLGGFDMCCVNEKYSCRTVGCMIGNYNAMVGRDPHCFGDRQNNEEQDDWDYFGITEDEYAWLFLGSPNHFYFDFDRPRPGLSDITKDMALARLRKFIYYKLHKQEMIYDERGCVTERSRTQEGNHGFASRAKVMAESMAVQS
jgi:hypothetical protein